jgi:branched-chain amino acid transport system permease protein
MPENQSLALRALRYAWPLIVPAGLLALLTLVVGTGDKTMTLVTTKMLIFVTLAVGVYIFSGNSGILSFGHMAFMAVGAYTSGLLTIPVLQKAALLPDLPGFLADAHLSTALAAIVGGLVAAAFAMVVAIPLMRLNGIAASIASLALLLVVQTVISNWESLTRGHSALIGVPVNSTVGNTLLVAVLAMAVAYVYQTSRRGLLLRASREDPRAARAAGINIYRERYLAFALSAFVTGVGGAMYAHYLGVMRPDAGFFLDPTFMVVTMLVVGGINSLSGAVLGTVVISAISEVLRRLASGEGGLKPGLQTVILGVFLLVMLITRPSGLTGGREVPFPRRRRRDAPTPGAPAGGDLQTANEQEAVT